MIVRAWVNILRSDDVRRASFNVNESSEILKNVERVYV